MTWTRGHGFRRTLSQQPTKVLLQVGLDVEQSAANRYQQQFRLTNKARQKFLSSTFKTKPSCSSNAGHYKIPHLQQYRTLAAIFRPIMQNRNFQKFKYLITTFLLVSCQVSVKKEIEVEKHYPDGKVESRVFIQNGKKNGIATLFYPNGKLKEEGKWVNNKQEGLWTFYYEDGTVSGKINFANDLQNGQSIFYFPNGSLDQEVQFKDGKPNGISKSYYRDINKLKQQSEWIEGKRNGTVTIFDSLGNNSRKYLYKDDQLIKKYQ